MAKMSATPCANDLHSLAVPINLHAHVASSSSENKTLSKTGHPQLLLNLDLAEKSGNLQPLQRNTPTAG
eukprot:CAMPEP_0117464868 /NCGR_PEP_ID=MMETSP0784-20121206/4329_1 /TAXON_ID=39447 /ORGANISM="" /LENGTH=68 /DNA_ID=CAMNT_0005258753 /DNA_START=182 /DNA_END=389 /DNA_ORIENTATION=+